MPALKVMTFNVQLPSTAMAIGQGQADGAVDRAKAVASALLALPLRDRPDVIAFNEVFNESARDALLQTLPAVWNHVIKKVDDGGVGEDSGLMLFSRLPLVNLPAKPPLFPSNDVFFTTYRASALPDAGARKAVALARVDAPIPATNILFTHTQASYDAANSENRAERQKQFDEIVGFLKTAVGPGPSDWRNAILMGDLNVKGDPDAVTTEWNEIFKSGNVEFGKHFQDGWREHMHPPTGLSERDPGYSQQDTETGQLNRLDYQCFQIVDPVTRGLVPHHMFQRLRELSDHWSQEARIQLFTPHCTPATAIKFLGVAPAPSTSPSAPIKAWSPVRTTKVNVANTGGYQWLYVERPGTYSFFRDVGFELAVYGENDLTHPMNRLDVVSKAELPAQVKASLDRAIRLDPRGETHVSRTPFYVRVRAKSESATGLCTVGMIEHRGESAETALALLPHVDVDPQLPAGQMLGDEDTCWFRVHIPSKFDGEMHTEPFVLSNPENALVSVVPNDWARQPLDGSLPGPYADLEVITEITSTGDDYYLTLKRTSLASTDFLMRWNCTLSYLLLSRPLRLHIDDETGPNAIGSDTLRLDITVDNEHLFTETWDDADAGENWPDLQKKIRDVAVSKNEGNPTEEIVFSNYCSVVLNKLDGVAAHGSMLDILTPISPYDKDTEPRTAIITILDPLGDGRYTFDCVVSRFPANYI